MSLILLFKPKTKVTELTVDDIPEVHAEVVSDESDDAEEDASVGSEDIYPPDDLGSSHEDLPSREAQPPVEYVSLPPPPNGTPPSHSAVFAPPDQGIRDKDPNERDRKIQKDEEEDLAELSHNQRHISKSMSAAGLATTMRESAAFSARNAPFPAPRVVDPRGPAEVPGWQPPDIIPSNGTIMTGNIKKSVRKKASRMPLRTQEF